MSKRCSVKNRNGKRCGAWAVTGATQCALHSDPKRAAEMGSKHGRRVASPSSAAALAVPLGRLKSSGEVIELLEETINRVRQGPFDLRAANSIGFLSGILLKALEQQVEEPNGGHKRIENELQGITSLPRTKVEEEVLEHELMRLVVELDQDKHPAMKLEAIKAAYVVNGTLESKSTRRLSPSDNPNNKASAGIYMSLFNCPNVPASPALQKEGFDLFPPQSQEDDGVAPGPLPAAGESIDDPPTSPTNHPRVITVEVG